MDKQSLFFRWPRLVSVCCSLVVMLAPMASVAATLLPENDPQAQLREQFVALEKDIATASRSQLASLSARVDDMSAYPLYPYLQRALLLRDLSIRHRDDVESFLMQYEGRPFSYSVRADWLKYLADKGHKQAFLSSYRDGMGAEITCRYLDYQIEQANNPRYYLSKVDSIWMRGFSQPDECDPLFSLWRKNGLMTTDKVLTRIESAATQGDSRLLPYLKRQLPADQQYLADRWSQVRTAPRNVLKASLFPLKHPDIEARILMYGLERLAWQRPDDAIKGIALWQPKGVFTTEQQNELNRALAISLAIDNKPQAREWLQRADVSGAQSDVKRWHMAYELRQKQWQEALNVIGSATNQQQDDDNFVYWRGRSYEALGLKNMAQPLFEQLSGERHYYGFMASARLARQPSLMHAPTPRNDAVMDEIAALPAAQRAFELLQLGRLIDARREWRYLLGTLDTAKIKDAALLASEWGWYDQAIISYTQSGYMDDVERRFPLAYEPQFASSAQTYNVPASFAMAIARRESSFMTDAVSPAGATGLMQLMPSTAQYLAAKRINRRVLFEPEQNLDMGVQYLRYLMDKLDDNPVLVSASYNAGWRRVMEWLPEDNALPADVWIENIPYRETRHYVKAVLAYRYIYEQQLGTPSNLFSELASQSIPSAERITTAPDGSLLQLAPR